MLLGYLLPFNLFVLAFLLGYTYTLKAVQTHGLHVFRIVVILSPIIDSF